MAPAAGPGPGEDCRHALPAAGLWNAGLPRGAEPAELSSAPYPITLVENSRVSYSNPVRQSLHLEDCLDGCGSLFTLRTVWMAGVEEQVEEDVRQLERLTEQHDLVFLLMDTRESRWLPSVVAAANRKIVINAALGFDTFLVLAESAGDTKSAAVSEEIPGCQLLFYFCNDVVAPGNSLKDRTLDQQSTVTRSGVSMMAGALTVELLVSILQHPKGVDSPSETSSKEDNLTKEAKCSPGRVPRQVRGFLARFVQILPAGHALDKRTACSPVVLRKYRDKGSSSC
ncbi:hypothetical protein ACOMHN_028348 [Nucella lapillus]